jgi:hypothetical protein
VFQRPHFVRTALFSVVLLMLSISLASAATGSTAVSGGGTLSWTYTSTTQNCWTGVLTPFTVWNFASFVYVDSHGAKFSLGLGSAYINSPGGGSCPPNGPQPATGATATFSNAGTNFTLTFFPQSGGSGSASIATTGYSGYVNPKYIILGVTYAPPGPSSFVNYSNSTLVSNTTSLTSSFSNAFAASESVKASGGILGWLNGSVTASSSSTYTQGSSTTTSVTVSKQTSVSNQTPGPASPYVGVDHDYDVIWLWLNPTVHFTVNTNPAGTVQSVTWNGYGYSTLDQPAMDVYPLFVGWLNGDIAVPTSVKNVLARTWAAGEIWPSGQGPGLTSTGTVNDYKTIVQADPYWQCIPNPSACPTTVDGTRFTGPITGKSFIYQQAAVGGQPGTQTYTETYTNTLTQGQSASYSFAQTFGLETVFGGSLFGIGLEATLKQSDTLTWGTQWNKQFNTTNSSSAMLSITGPPCTVVLGVCNPLYTGPSDFDVYYDNLYGTFEFFPIR